MAGAYGPMVLLMETIRSLLQAHMYAQWRCANCGSPSTLQPLPWQLFKLLATLFCRVPNPPKLGFGVGVGAAAGMI